MKKFENVNIEVISFSMTDIISTSTLTGDKPGHAEDDVIDY